MDEFRANRKKAFAKATVQEIDQKSETVIKALTTIWPQGAVALALVHASFGIRIAYKQEVLNQFTEHLRDNPDVYTTKIIESQDFQDGLIVVLDSYFKLRTDEKRELAEKIFYDFGKNSEKPFYPLERYTDTLEKISESGIRFLGFIEHRIPEIRLEYAEKKFIEHGNAESERVRMLKVYTETEPLSTFVEEFIKNEAMKEQKEPYGEMHVSKLRKSEESRRNDINLIVSELTYLGIINQFKVGVGTWGAGGGQDAYNLSDYGKMFVSIIKPSIAR